MVYVGRDDHTPAVLQVIFTLQSAGRRRLVVAVAEDSPSFRLVREFDLLRKQLDRFNGQVALVAPERALCHSLARAAGFPTFARVEEARQSWAGESD